MSSKIDFTENASSPATPSAGKLSLYAKDDGSLYAKNDAGTETNLTSGGGGGAPTDATYILQVADGDLANAQALGALGTGLLKNTTATGVLSIAAASDVPDLPASKIASGEIPVERGGTGVATLANGGLLRGAGTSDVEVISGSAVGDIPAWDGTDYVNTQPTMRLLASGQLGSATASISIASIPSTYTSLRLITWVRSTVAAVNEALFIRVNSDTTTSNYRSQYVGASTTTVLASTNNGANATLLNIFTNGSSAPANSFTVIAIDLFDYADTSKITACTGNSWSYFNTNAYLGFVNSGAWLDTSIVSSIQISAASGNLDTGTGYSLYGLK